jgi:hypothetical protein
MTRTVALTTISLAASIGTIFLAVATPATENNRLAGALGITFGGLVAPAVLLTAAARSACQD